MFEWNSVPYSAICRHGWQNDRSLEESYSIQGTFSYHVATNRRLSVNKNVPCRPCRIVWIGTLDDDRAVVLRAEIDLLLADAVSAESELLLAGTVEAELLDKKLVNDTWVEKWIIWNIVTMDWRFLKNIFYWNKDCIDIFWKNLKIL